MPAPRPHRAASGLLLLALGLTLSSCALLTGVRRQAAAPLGLGIEGREDPALSGDGRYLASVVERGSRRTVLLQERQSGRILPLRHLGGQQPHSSPSLSWNGRYLAVVVQQGAKRLALIEDRATGARHPLYLPGDLEPERLSLAPDGRRIALELLDQGRSRVEVFDLGALLEPDLAPGQGLSGSPP
ncbi:Tol biopolymer transporter periplasmic protein [Cyanobium sp. ATX 6F1]|uniref:TolB family protein n=1 Tax=unclassified Cyanobium TaxID=2627006 RepID=UPI0028F44A29|nr:Tol biopolymer transporter periplasmic protein [Cyanobium sp. ATX 6F1]